MLEFCDYFESTWINGFFPPTLWTHYDHDGPRTTNLTEGWDNSLNTSFGTPHPSLRNVIHYLQKYQFQVQCRGQQLGAGRPAKVRAPAYVKLDYDIMHAKVKFAYNVGRIMCHMLPRVKAWDMFDDEIGAYLRHVSYLVVGTDNI